MVDYIYPSAVQLQAINQELLPRMEAARPIFRILPTRSVDEHLLEWEQRNNYKGLQQIRGLNGEPKRVKAIGGQRFQMQPGVYGEYGLIDELQLTTRRPWGTFTGHVDVTDMVREKQEQLLVRRLDRIEQIGWTLLSTGAITVADGPSTLWSDAYTFQTYGPNTPWATTATSTPLADLRAVQLKARGLSVNFGTQAELWMNQSTLNDLLANTNSADIGGRRGPGLTSLDGLTEFNALLTRDGLPNIVVYDQGYLDDTGTFQLFIPNNKVILIGARTDGDPIGEYRFTRNANNADMGPGPYMRVVDEPERIPRQIEVHDGHNGGPVLFHPQAIVLITV